MPDIKKMRLIRNEVSQAEINNMVYICLKHVWSRTFQHAAEPENIKAVMLDLYNQDVTIENIVKAVGHHMMSEFGSINLIDIHNNTRDAYQLLQGFVQKPQEIRENLEGVNMDFFITWH